MGRIQFAFLDSGTGGIPYMRHLKAACPSAHCVYVGDTAHFPYGEKSSVEITECASKTVGLIIERFNPEAIVIACNTISVTSLTYLRQRFAIPFIGTVPAVKLAATVTQNRRIGLLATSRTVGEPYTDDLIERFAPHCFVAKRADSELISYIEHNLFTAGEAERRAACKPAIDFFLSREVDTIILGCTHFIHFSRELQDLAGSGVRVIDSRDGVVRQALRVAESFERAGIPAEWESDPQIPDQALFVTGMKNSGDETEYRGICSYLGIPFMGVLSADASKF